MLTRVGRPVSEVLAVASLGGEVFRSVAIWHVSMDLNRRRGAACPSRSWVPWPGSGAGGLGRVGRRLAEFLHLAAHLLDLTLQEVLLKPDDLLRVLGAHELLGEVEGRLDVRFREVHRLAVDV